MDPEICNLRLSIRFNQVIFSFDVAGFTRALTEKGYIPLAQIPPEDAAGIRRMGYNGPLARKDSTTIDLNCDRQFIGVTDPTLAKLVDRFTEVQSIIEGQMPESRELTLWFAEFQAHVRFKGTKEPRKVLQDRTGKLDLLCDIGQIFDSQLSLIGVKAAVSGRSADSPDYFEVMIEPSPGKEGSSFDAILILRNKEIHETLDFARKLEERLPRLIKEF